MIYDLEGAKQRVDWLDNARISRTLSDSSKGFQHVFQLLPLLLHINHPSLPGYVVNTPHGIADFVLSDYQAHFLHSHDLNKHKNISKMHRAFDAILGVYVMGSMGTLAQTPLSDLDIWVCHREDLSLNELAQMQQKLEQIQNWAQEFAVELHFYLVDQSRFRHLGYSQPLTNENCGSAQYMFLLEEFYRSAFRLAGKPLLWQHLLVDESEYDSEVARLIKKRVIDPRDWVDFGGLGSLSANEYFGATLWHLYKSIDAPFKSILKVLLLETYSYHYPQTYLISQEFKHDLLTDKQEPSHQFDAYLAMLERVTEYLTERQEFKRLDFVRTSLYIKVREGYDGYSKNWRLERLNELVEKWGWNSQQVDFLNQRASWKIRQVQGIHQKHMKFLMLSYRNLVDFVRKYKVNVSIIPQDISLLTRKLYTAFEELPGKITILNPSLSLNLSEPHLTFIEVKQNSQFKKGWYLVNQSPDIQGFARPRMVEYSESLNKLVAWAYFNRLLTVNTKLAIFSENVDLITLREFVFELRLTFPDVIGSVNNDQLSRPCEIRYLAVIVNLVQDPTCCLTEVKSPIKASDLFSFGPEERSLVGSIDLTYRNVWNEVRTLHFEGPNAILLALKVLSNKIHRGTPPPESVQVLCYSRYYRRALRKLVTTMVQKCINIQLGTSSPPSNNLLRVAGKNWQFLFEDSGISLQEIQNIPKEQPSALLEDITEEEEPINRVCHNHHYPTEIDNFASEGFFQFFFENNANGTFNVYILDETNRIEIYRQCEGEKEQKIDEINHIYQSSGLEERNNPYKIVQRNFNYPQFYQLVSSEDSVKIVPFRSRIALS